MQEIVFVIELSRGREGGVENRGSVTICLVDRHETLTTHKILQTKLLFSLHLSCHFSMLAISSICLLIGTHYYTLELIIFHFIIDLQSASPGILSAMAMNCLY